MPEHIRQLWHWLIGSERNHHAVSSQEECVARPIVTVTQTQSFSWGNETILFLGKEAGLVELGRALSTKGATVAFRSLACLQDIYLLPLEQYTMVVLPSAWDGLEFDIADIGGILRRADQALILVWASEKFIFSHLADEAMRGFYDIALTLPATAENLELFLRSDRSSAIISSDRVPLSSI